MFKLKKTNLIFIFIVLFCGIIIDMGFSQVPQNMTYYVDGVNGDDNDNGSLTNPFKTISHAIDVAYANHMSPKQHTRKTLI